VVKNIAGGIMARIKIKNLDKYEEITKSDLRKVKGGSLSYRTLISTFEPSRPLRPTSINEYKPNFNPYATENAVAGIRG